MSATEDEDTSRVGIAGARTLRPPVTNAPPSGAHDPHGDVPETVAARTQISRFLKPSGAVTDVCGGAPCHTDAFTP